MLITLDAIDLDIGENAELVYSVETNFQGRISVDKVTGELRLKQPLDYEHVSYALFKP